MTATNHYQVWCKLDPKQLKIRLLQKQFFIDVKEEQIFVNSFNNGLKPYDMMFMYRKELCE